MEIYLIVSIETILSLIWLINNWKTLVAKFSQNVPNIRSLFAVLEIIIFYEFYCNPAILVHRIQFKVVSPRPVRNPINRVTP